MKYNLIIRAIMVGMVFVFTPFSLYSQEIAEPGAIISYLDGTVRVQKPESEGWMTAEFSKALLPGDKLETSKKSRAELRFESDNFVRLNQNSIIGFNINSDSLSAKTSIAKLIEGDFWFRLAAGDSKFEITCPLKSGNSLTLTIPDTSFAVVRISIGTDSTFEARIYAGLMAIAIAKPDSGRDSLNSQYYQSPNTAYISSSEKILITSSGRIVFKGNFDPNDIDEKIEWVDWNKERDSHY